METKYVRVPFDIEMAKKITNGKVEGKVVTRDDGNARIICWDAEGDQPIIALIKYHDKEYPHSFCLNGLLQDGDCLNGDLMLEIPEYMTFKDGDIYKTKSGSIAIYNGNYQAIINNTPYYVGLRISDNKLIFQYNNYGFGIIKKCSLDVGEEEKQKLIDALKASKEPRAKEYLKRFFNIELKPKYKFNPYDKVLVRDDKEHDWNADLFSHINKLGNFVCLGSSWVYCIPYNDQTKHLLGTTDNWEE